jgi:hypothetical protein
MKLYIEIPHILDLEQLKLEQGLNKIDFNVNDNKKIVPMFEGKYSQFIMRTKGLSINSKDDLIKILNEKPRSFLYRLTNLVNNFKSFDSKLINNLRNNKIHPRNLISLNKQINNFSNQPNQHLTKGRAGFEIGKGEFLNTPTKKNNNFPLNSKSPYPVFTVGKDGKPINMYQDLLNKAYTLITDNKQIDSRLYLISNKIHHLIKTLSNNKLAIPLNLLKPLLDINPNFQSNIKSNLNLLPLQNKNSKISNNNINKDNLNLISQPSHNPVKGVVGLRQIEESKKFLELDVNSLTKFLSDLSKNKLLSSPGPFGREKLFNNGIRPSYISQINKFKDNIKLFNNNDLSNITFTKYFELITAYKIVKPFHQYIRYNFNIQNNKQIKNIFMLLEYAFKAMSCLISKPVFFESHDKVIINLFYCFIPGKSYKLKYGNRGGKNNRFNNNKYNSNSTNNSNLDINNNNSIPKLTSLNGIDIKNNEEFNSIKDITSLSGKMRFQYLNKHFLTNKNINKLNKLCTILSRILKKEVKLDLIPLSVPLFDDNILVKAIGIMSKTINLKKIFTSIYRNSTLYSKVQADYLYRYSTTQSYLAGIKVRIGGRLMGRSIVPRESRIEFQRGATSKTKVTFVD